MITYNHEAYIRQALESILMQNVNFEHEVVIGDDYSTDNTRNIILEYQRKYPEIIYPRMQEKNLGLIENFVRTYKSCKGEYIVTIDGDDYWTSPKKLQIQSDFLDENRSYSMCFHPVEMVFEEGSRPSRIFPQLQGTTFTLEDILRSNFIPTCSVMFRNGLFGEFPSWYYSLKIEDWPLYVLNAQHGEIGFLDEVMGVYRIHAGGAWSSNTEENKYMENIEFYDCMEKHFQGKYRNIIKMMLYQCHYKLALLYEERNNMHLAKSNLIKSLSKYPHYCKPGLLPIVRMATRLYFPSICNYMKSQ